MGEVKAAYAAKEPKEDKSVISGKTEKTEGHERKSVKAQIAEKKDIIAKAAAEKAKPVINHDNSI